MCLEHGGICTSGGPCVLPLGVLKNTWAVEHNEASYPDPTLAVH